MKHILIAALIATSLSAHAGEKERLEGCKVIGEVANSAMTVRQMGIPITKPLALAEKASAEIRPMMIAIVKEAYKKPAFTSEEYKIKIINEFTNYAIVSCLG